jgi:hypothetical protein
MKIRQIKFRHHTRMWVQMHVNRLYRELEMPFAKFSEHEVGGSDAGMNSQPSYEEVLNTMLQDAFAKAETEKTTYTVVRKKDGVQVAVFDSHNEALAMIEKAKQQKKAALQIA